MIERWGGRLRDDLDAGRHYGGPFFCISLVLFLKNRVRLGPRQFIGEANHCSNQWVGRETERERERERCGGGVLVVVKRRRRIAGGDTPPSRRRWMLHGA